MTHLMTEQMRAVLMTVAAIAVVVVALLFIAPFSVENDPCQAWFDRHGEVHPRC